MNPHTEALSAAPLAAQRVRLALFDLDHTLIPLDLLFVDERGRIIHIHHNAQPLDETVIYSNGLATAVLEINGGMAAQFGIGPGSDLQHESFDQTVAHWPCEAS